MTTARRPQPEGRTNQPLLSRRRVLAGAGALGVAAAVDALAIEPAWLDVNHYDVPVPKLPGALEGYRVAQVTDAHLRNLGRVETDIAAELERSNAQLVVLTGDIVNSRRDFGLLKEFCRSLVTRERKVFATLGNWEYWGGVPPDDLAAAYSAAGATLVGNDAVFPDSGLCIVATDDSLTQRARLDVALAKRKTAPVSLFLTHCPELFDRMPPSVERFDLALAGHTHGGQARVGSFAPFVPPGSGRFVSGWYDLPFGRAYVSRGTGLTFVPARFGCRPELPVFTLRRA